VFSTGSAADPVATTIATFTANGYNSVEYTYVSGDEFNIGNFGAATPSTNPVNFELPVQIVDGDGDVAGSSIGITLAAAGQGISNNSASLVGVTLTSSGVLPHIIGSDHADTLTGNSAANILFGGLANDILSGGLGDDTLIGGLGQDTMTGGGGADAFVVSADAIGGSINDIITDYNFGQGDSIDLTELLNNLVGVTNLEGGGYVNITAGANAQIQVDVDGSANGVNFQTVAVLQGYTHVDEAIKILFDDGSTIKSDLA
jgi:Ca2+-binding RTX toxin-like protein